MNSVVLKSESAQDTSNQVAIAEERESNNEEERKRAEQEAARKKAEEEAARKTQNVSHPMLNNISDSESDCYEEATIVNNTQPFQFIHLPPPPVQPQSKQSTYRSPAPHSTPPSPPIEKEKGFIDKLLMNLRIRSGCHVALSVRIHL